jgi:hypothetical protein
VTARYTKAIEQLGSDRLDVRVGGIYALECIAHDSPRDHLAVLEVLAAFIREQRSRAMATERARHGDARADNAPRCTGCGCRNWAPNPQARPGVSLARANPAAANLTGAPLRSDAGVPRAGNRHDSGRWKQADTSSGGAATHLLRLDRVALLAVGDIHGRQLAAWHGGQRGRLRDLSAVGRLVPW